MNYYGWIFSLRTYKIKLEIAKFKWMWGKGSALEESLWLFSSETKQRAICQTACSFIAIIDDSESVSSEEHKKIKCYI